MERRYMVPSRSRLIVVFISIVALCAAKDLRKFQSTVSAQALCYYYVVVVYGNKNDVFRNKIKKIKYSETSKTSRFVK